MPRRKSIWTNCVLSATSVLLLVLVPSTSEAVVPGGTTRWVSRYTGPDSGPDFANSLVASPDGLRVFVTGPSLGTTTDSDYATVAYDASTGVQLWVRRFNGPADGDDVATSIATGPDGSKVFVTGYSFRFTTGFNYTTVAYDAATGATLWVRRFSSPGNHTDQAFSVTAAPGGSEVFVTGSNRTSTSSDDYTTIAYDASSGATLWVSRYDGPADDSDVALSAVASRDGSMVFVTGESVGATTSYDDVTVAYDAANGAEVWVRRYDGPGHDFDAPRAIASSPNGSMVFVTGESVGATTSYDYATIAYDAASGNTVWVRRYSGPGSAEDFATAIAATAHAVFVTGGSSGSTTGIDYATTAYNASSGATLWVKRSNGPADGNDAAFGIAARPDGSRVFVTGAVPTLAHSFDYGTVAYNALSGVTAWTRRYNGPADSDDAANSIAVSPNGSLVYVTGNSTGTTTGADFATIAYEA